MNFDEHVVAILGSIDSASTHTLLKVSSLLGIPVIDTGASDPTIAETRTSWLFHNFPDDREQSRVLAEYIFTQLKLNRIGLLRVDDSYGRIAAREFKDQAVRLGHPSAIEVQFVPGSATFSKHLQSMQDAQIDGLVIIGEPAEAAAILKQMRAMRMTQPVFGLSRLGQADLVARTGPAAEGMVTVCVLDPSRTDPKWQAFQKAFRSRYGESPDPYASYAYDGMRNLLRAITNAGLQRTLIMNALHNYQNRTYEGVNGSAGFDDITTPPAALARAEGGRFVYWTVSQRKASQE
jgi:branched-chain amino acid transport system substrate-binding protein